MIEIDDIVEARAALLGEAGAAWLANLPDRIERLCRAWSLTPERALTGGTEALVLRVRQSNGELAALKLGLPGNTAREAHALRIAAGRGYATLIRYAADDDALLLEWMGEKLVDTDLPSGEQMRLIIDAVRRSWTRVDDPAKFMSGAAKADWHLNFMRDEWHRVADRFPSAVQREALAYASERKAAYDPSTSVLVHGDAHAWNALVSSQAPVTACKLIDPDGLFMEPAYDVAVSMREWPEELLAGDPKALAAARLHNLARLADLPPEPIRQWGYIEIVSTGLVYHQLNDAREGDRYLGLAAELAER